MESKLNRDRWHCFISNGRNRQESGVRNIYQLALGCKSRILRSQDGSLSILYREVLTTEERGYETGYGMAGSNVL